MVFDGGFLHNDQQASDVSGQPAFDFTSHVKYNDARSSLTPEVRGMLALISTHSPLQNRATPPILASGAFLHPLSIIRRFCE